MKKANFLLLLLATPLMLAACAPVTPRVDANFGEATMAIKAQQVRDPAAPIRNENRPVDGLDGKAASQAIDRYHQSFTVPSPPMTVLNIGVGGGGK